MTKFITTLETRDEIQRLLRHSSEAILAVAFIGRGAKKWIEGRGINFGNISIICDIESGACNPDEIQILIDSGVKLLAKRRLHAKVFWTPECVIVGSSNLSANGLGFEGDEISSNIEASFSSSNTSIINAVKIWIDNEVIPTASGITPSMIEQCRIAWKKRRDDRDKVSLYTTNTINHATIAKCIKNNPEYFRDKSILLWVRPDEAPSVEADKILDETKNEFPDENLDMWEIDDEKLLIPFGCYVIDYYHKNGVVSDGDMWKMADLPLVKRYGTMVMFAYKVEKFENMNYRGSVKYFQEFVKLKINGKPNLNQKFILPEIAEFMKSKY